MASFVRAAASIDSGGDDCGGKEPDPKRRRRLDAGGPIEDDETARQKMRDAGVYERGVDGVIDEYVGFDPDNVRDIKSIFADDARKYNHTAVNPMCYFAEKGDLPMMRWLYVNGADSRDCSARDGDSAWSFPMLKAALWNHLVVCKWLLQHGAARDATRRNANGVTPLSGSFGDRRNRNVSRWLILNGALCKDDDSGELDVETMMHDLGRQLESSIERHKLLQWAREHHQSRSSFDVFLMGTLSAPTYSEAKLRESLFARIHSSEAVDRLLGNTPSHQYPLLWGEIFPQRIGCPLKVFAGKSGILELIGDYVGILRGREARIICQLTEILPGVTAEIDAELVARYIEGLSDSDDSDSDDSDNDSE